MTAFGMPKSSNPVEEVFASTNEVYQFFFAQFVHIMLALPQAAWLSIFKENQKSVVLRLHEGSDLGRLIDEIEKRKSPASGRIRTHVLSVTRRVLYRCATTAALASSILIFRCFWTSSSRSTCSPAPLATSSGLRSSAASRCESTWAECRNSGWTWRVFSAVYWESECIEEAH